jgi:hypothetical protein
VANDFSLYARDATNAGNVPLMQVSHDIYNRTDLTIGDTALNNLNLKCGGIATLSGVGGIYYIQVGSGGILYTNSSVFTQFSDSNFTISVYNLGQGGRNITIAPSNGLAANRSGGNIRLQPGLKTAGGTGTDGCVEIGTAASPFATTGTVRVDKDFSLYSRNAQNTANTSLLALDGSNGLFIGDTTLNSILERAASYITLQATNTGLYFQVTSTDLSTSSSSFTRVTDGDFMIGISATGTGGRTITLAASDAVATNTNGGNVRLKPGLKTGTGIDGGVQIGTGATAYASTGTVRAQNDFALKARNAANAGDLNLIAIQATDQIQFGDAAAGLVSIYSQGNIVWNSGGNALTWTGTDLYFNESLDHSLYITARASDNPTKTLTIKGQDAYASATGSNRVGGVLALRGGAGVGGQPNGTIDIYDTVRLQSLGSGNFPSVGAIRTRAASNIPIITGMYSDYEYAIMTWGGSSQLIIGHTALLDNAINSPTHIYLVSQYGLFITFWQNNTHWLFNFPGNNAYSELQAYNRAGPVKFTHRQQSGDNPTNSFSIIAQAASSTATGNNRDGGTVIIQGGAKAGTGIDGGVKLNTGDAVTVAEIKYVTSGSLNVLSFINYGTDNGQQRTVSANYTVDNDGPDRTIFVNANGITISLPSAQRWGGRRITIMSITGTRDSMNLFTIVASGTDTIQGTAGNYVVSGGPYTALTLESNGTNTWWIVSRAG